MKVNQALSKQFAESVTRSASKLLRDRFFRTELVIIASLCFLCLANIVIVGVASYYVNVNATAIIRESNAKILANDSFVVNPDITNQGVRRDLRHLRNSTLVVASTAGVILTLLLGFFIARTALNPTRNALAAQKQFIANIAHELRTPLSIIKANNELLRLERPEDEEIGSMTYSNQEELDRISGIINNLLTLNTFQNNEMSELKPVNISRAIHEILDQMHDISESKGQNVIRKISSDLFVLGNRSAIDQICRNLIKNASAYTPKGGTITIAVSAIDHKYVEIKVEDSGIGIEASKINYIFQPFYQVDSSRSGNQESHGLGLAIVSELVKMHKGRIAVQSTKDIGTTIKVWIPAIDPKTDVAKNRQQTGEVFLDFS